MSNYIDNGWSSREEYLAYISEEYSVDMDTVFSIANLLGQDEDFDGLVAALEDHTGGCE